MQINESYTHEFSYTQEDVIKFAEVSGDTNPLHLDKEFAATTVFKQPIIHGILAASVFSKVLGTTFPGPGSVYLGQQMNFLRPMFVDTVYRAEFTIKEVDGKKGSAIISTEIFDATTNKKTVTGQANVMNKVHFTEVAK